MDYYPVSFSFQFGTRLYSSSNTLKSLKVCEQLAAGPSIKNKKSYLSDKEAIYRPDEELYLALNNLFRIPVLDNEYQKYKITTQRKSRSNSPGYKTVIKSSNDSNRDYYYFDPLLLLQEENIRDGCEWQHPDLSSTRSYTPGEHFKGDANKRGAATEYGLKNRILFIVNNRTAKGNPVDTSQIRDGYGIYELPIEVKAARTVINKKRSVSIENPEPEIENIRMCYPLDTSSEYVDLSLSADHRYLVVFSVNNGYFFADIIDADRWKSPGPVRLFPASEKLSYNWGKDGSLAVTNHEGYMAIIVKEKGSYEMLFNGKVPDRLDRTLFSSKTLSKEHSYSKYQYGRDSNLALTVSGRKAALVQNPLVGNSDDDIRNAALECVVFNPDGLIYRGLVESNIIDLNYSMTDAEVRADYKDATELIKPADGENRVVWK